MEREQSVWKTLRWSNLKLIIYIYIYIYTYTHDPNSRNVGTFFKFEKKQKTKRISNHMSQYFTIYYYRT